MEETERGVRVFYLKKVIAVLEEKRAVEKLERLGEAVREQEIVFIEQEVGDPEVLKLGEEKEKAPTAAGEQEGKQSRKADEPEVERQKMREPQREEEDSGKEGVLWITDHAGLAEKLIAGKQPLLIYLHPWNREALFPLAGFAMEEPQEIEPQYLEKVYRRFAGIPWDILETERCLVREMTLEDLPELEALYEDGEVKRFIGGFYEREEPPGAPDGTGMGKAPGASEGGIGASSGKEGQPDGEGAKIQTGSGSERIYRGPGEEHRRMIERYIREVYGFYGYGIWTVEERLTGRVIGRVGFRRPDRESGAGGAPILPGTGSNAEDMPVLPELGYMIGAKWRGRGIACEVCGAVLEYGKKVLGFSRVQAVVQKENLPSLAVCGKLGFREEGPVTEEGRECVRLIKTL